MGNSNTTLQMIVRSAARRIDIAPVLASGGSSDQPALDIATDVMNAMIRGGPDGQRMNWKWNRFNVIPAPVAGTIMAGLGGFGTFFTNSWQQDYAVLGLLNVDWLEQVAAVNINQTAQPKQVLWPEAVRDLPKTYFQTGQPCQVCWLPNYMLDWGIWGQSSLLQVDGLNNPGPGAVYTNPLGATVAPSNPITQIQDPNGNYWVLTTYGTCGGSLPTFPATPTFPTLANPKAAASTVPDGSCVWTAVNPSGMGFRIDPLPPETGVVWLVRCVAQKTPVIFTSLGQTLDPLPDDHVPWFRQGFEAKCYQKSIDAKVRAKFEPEWKLWLKGLDNAVRAGNREPDSAGFYPGSSIMDSGGATYPGPAYPFPGWWGG